MSKGTFLNRFSGKGGRALAMLIIGVIVFITSLIAVINFSRANIAKSALNRAAEEGARFASLLPDVENRKDEVKAVVISKLAPSSIAAQNIIVDTAGCMKGVPLKVTVTHNFKPLLSGMMFGGKGVVFSAVSSMEYKVAAKVSDIPDQAPKVPVKQAEKAPETEQKGAAAPPDVEKSPENEEKAPQTPEKSPAIKEKTPPDSVNADSEKVSEESVKSPEKPVINEEPVLPDKTIVETVKPNKDPVARINAEPDEGYAPLTVKLDALQSSDEDGEIKTYFWDLDGFGINSYEKEITVKYPSKGKYTVTLTVIDDEGGMDIVKETIMVKEAQPAAAVQDSSKPSNMNSQKQDNVDGNKPPVAKITKQTQEPYYPGDVIDLDGSDSYDPDGHIVLWHWSFDSSVMDPEPIIAGEPGKYTASLTVRDDAGAESTDTIIVEVLNQD